MTLRHDRKISVKLLAAARLLRQIEDDGVDETLPATSDLAATIDSEFEIVTVFIDVVDGEPQEHTVGVSPMGDDQPPTSAYAFAVDLPVGDGTVADQTVAEAVVESIRELCGVYGMQGML